VKGISFGRNSAPTAKFVGRKKREKRKTKRKRRTSRRRDCVEEKNWRVAATSQRKAPALPPVTVCVPSGDQAAHVSVPRPENCSSVVVICSAATLPTASNTRRTIARFIANLPPRTFVAQPLVGVPIADRKRAQGPKRRHRVQDRRFAQPFPGCPCLLLGVHAHADSRVQYANKTAAVNDKEDSRFWISDFRFVISHCRFSIAGPQISYRRKAAAKTSRSNHRFHRFRRLKLVKSFNRQGRGGDFILDGFRIGHIFALLSHSR